MLKVIWFDIPNKYGEIVTRYISCLNNKEYKTYMDLLNKNKYVKNIHIETFNNIDKLQERVDKWWKDYNNGN